MQRYPVQSVLEKNSRQVVKQPSREHEAHSRQVSAVQDHQFLSQSTTRLLSWSWANKEFW